MHSLVSVSKNEFIVIFSFSFLLMIQQFFFFPMRKFSIFCSIFICWEFLRQSLKCINLYFSLQTGNDLRPASSVRHFQNKSLNVVLRERCKQNQLKTVTMFFFLFKQNNIQCNFRHFSSRVVNVNTNTSIYNTTFKIILKLSSVQKPRV